jgi:phenylpyruvate tautomerase PptA (4-oxalocrotonate tautomerase family)
LPFIRVTTPADLLSNDERAAIAERLTVEIMKIETGGRDTPGFRAISALVFDEIPAGRWSIGGKIAADEAAALIEIRVPSGALVEDRRQRMAAAAHNVLISANAKLAAADGVRRIWTHMIEIAEGNWGAGGQIVSLPDVRLVAAGDSLSPVQPFNRAN